jgi:hypothetical protein
VFKDVLKTVLLAPVPPPALSVFRVSHFSMMTDLSSALHASVLAGLALKDSRPSVLNAERDFTLLEKNAPRALKIVRIAVPPAVLLVLKISS